MKTISNMFFLILLFVVQNKGLCQSFSLSRNLAKVSDDHFLVYQNDISFREYSDKNPGYESCVKQFKYIRSSVLAKVQEEGRNNIHTLYYELTVYEDMIKKTYTYNDPYARKRDEIEYKTQEEAIIAAFSKYGCKSFQYFDNKFYNTFKERVYH